MAADGAAAILQQLYLGGTAGPELPEAVMAFEDGGVLPPMLIPSPSPSPALPPPPSPSPPQGQACIPEQEALVLVSRLIADVSTLPLPSSLYCEGAPAPATVHAHVEQLLMRDPAVFLERYGRYLTMAELHFFVPLARSAPQGETAHWLSQMLQAARAREDPTRLPAAIKNRRLAALRRLEAASAAGGEAYFSDAAMRRRDPLLYHQMLGRHLGDSLGEGVLDEPHGTAPDMPRQHHHYHRHHQQQPAAAWAGMQASNPDDISEHDSSDDHEPGRDTRLHRGPSHGGERQGEEQDSSDEDEFQAYREAMQDQLRVQHAQLQAQRAAQAAQMQVKRSTGKKGRAGSAAEGSGGTSTHAPVGSSCLAGAIRGALERVERQQRTAAGRGQRMADTAAGGAPPPPQNAAAQAQSPIYEATPEPASIEAGPLPGHQKGERPGASAGSKHIQTGSHGVQRPIHVETAGFIAGGAAAALGSRMETSGLTQGPGPRPSGTAAAGQAPGTTITAAAVGSSASGCVDGRLLSEQLMGQWEEAALLQQAARQRAGERAARLAERAAQQARVAGRACASGGQHESHGQSEVHADSDDCMDTSSLSGTDADSEYDADADEGKTAGLTHGCASRQQDGTAAAMDADNGNEDGHGKVNGKAEAGPARGAGAASRAGVRLSAGRVHAHEVRVSRARRELQAEMKVRFLTGQDAGIDYASIDADTSLDADLIDEAGRDAEEAYFDGEDVEAEVQMHEEGGHAVCTDTGVQDY